MDANIPPKMLYQGDALLMDTAPMSEDALDAIKDAISTLEKAYIRACKATAMPPLALSELKVTYLSQLLRLETIIMTEQKRPRQTMDEIWDKAVPDSADNPVRTLNTLLPLKSDETQEASQEEPQDKDTETERDQRFYEEASPSFLQDYPGDVDSGENAEF